MRFRPVCPYYGKQEGRCELGFGYISPHDVEVIVRHCTSRYGDCLTYQRLTDEASGCRLRAVDDAVEAPNATVSASDVLLGVADREALMSLHHELRTPLTSIRSFIEILMRYPIEDLDSKRHFLSIIHEEAKRLSRTVDAVFGSAEQATGSPEALTLSRFAGDREQQRAV